MWCRRNASDDSDYEEEEEEGAGNRQVPVCSLLEDGMLTFPATHVRALLCDSPMLA